MPGSNALSRPDLPKPMGLVEAGPRQYRVLLVDDEPTVLNLLFAVLNRAGFEVLTASSGRDAWTLFSHSLPRIDVLVTDIEMPGMSGLELANLVSRSRPELPILFISGNQAPSYSKALPCQFLQKPFLPATFIESVYSLVRQAELSFHL